MARTTTKTTRAPAKRAPEPAPKKRVGRPVGSKNRVPATVTKARSAPAPVQKRTAARKAPPAAPKLNKAELEAQVVKLERTVARLRKQNAEMKQAARQPAPAPEPAPTVAATPDKKPKRAAAAPKARRSSKRDAAQDTNASAESDENSED